jgi:hypothetical protein
MDGNWSFDGRESYPRNRIISSLLGSSLFNSLSSSLLYNSHLFSDLSQQISPLPLPIQNAHHITLPIKFKLPRLRFEALNLFSRLASSILSSHRQEARHSSSSCHGTTIEFLAASSVLFPWLVK